MSDTRLTFKEMCAKFDVTPRTLRYYEYIELLQPTREGRSRFYGSKEIARMTIILRGRRWGYQLEGIRQFLLIYEDHGTQGQREAWVKSSTRQLKVLTEQRAQLDEAILDLTESRDYNAAVLAKNSSETP